VYQILGHIPPGAQGWRIATVFDRAEPEPVYSVFARWAEDRRVVRSFTLAWFHPGQDLHVQAMVLPDACARAAEDFDLVLKWDHATASYQRLEHGLDPVCRNQ
jgi:hypothetical protein